MKISNFADRLIQALQIRKISAAELSRKTGVAEGTISNYKKGVYEAKQDRVLEFSKALNVNPAWLMGYDVPMQGESTDAPDYSHIKNVMPVPETKQLPVIGTIACGTPILAEQNIEDMVNVPAFVHADFVLRCSGDSMIGAHIRDGDLVCIRIQPDVDDGQIAAVLIGEEATLKRVYHRPNGVTLMAENPAFPPMVYIGEECEDIRIMGKAITCMSKVR